MILDVNHQLCLEFGGVPRATMVGQFCGRFSSFSPEMNLVNAFKIHSKKVQEDEAIQGFEIITVVNKVPTTCWWIALIITLFLRFSTNLQSL